MRWVIVNEKDLQRDRDGWHLLPLLRVMLEFMKSVVCWQHASNLHFYNIMKQYSLQEGFIPAEDEVMLSGCLLTTLSFLYIFPGTQFCVSLF